MSNIDFKRRPAALAVAAILGVAAAMGGSVSEQSGSFTFIGSAQADEGTPKGAGGPTGDKGAHGAKPAGAGGSGQGQGGPSADSDAKGPRFGGDGSKPTAGSQGGRPVWAQEGVPSDAELGRLNVARAPSHVIDRALNEALAELQPKFYNEILAIANGVGSLDEKIAALQALVKLSFTDTTYVRIDSPLQNLGLYKDVIVDGTIVAKVVSYENLSSTAQLLMAAVFVGGAADKTLPVTTATVDAITKIMSLTLPAGMSAADLAKVSDAVRAAISEAHG